jgi:hypothetical protein
MPWVVFTADHDWRVKPHVMIAYKAGMKCLVTSRCATEAIAKGKARPQKPLRETEDAFDGSRKSS